MKPIYLLPFVLLCFPLPGRAGDLLGLTTTVTGTGGCMPFRWDKDGTWLYDSYTPTGTADAFAPTWMYSVPWKRSAELMPGDLNYRMHGKTDENPGLDTCADLAK